MHVRSEVEPIQVQLAGDVLVGAARKRVKLDYAHQFFSSLSSAPAV
jgi:hypothetical protein